jgi:hypothetical protein
VTDLWTEACSRAHRATITLGHDQRPPGSVAIGRTRSVPRLARLVEHGSTTAYRYGCRCDPCRDAKKAANSQRTWTPAVTDEHAAAYRQRLYDQAVAEARGELAELIAEQATDDRTHRVWSVSIDADFWPHHPARIEWDDPTFAEVAARVAA